MGNDRGDHGVVGVEKGAGVVRVFVEMPMGELQLADAGTNRTVGRVAGGPEETVVIEDDRFVEWDGNGHFEPGQEVTSALGEELGQVGADGD